MIASRWISGPGAKGALAALAVSLGGAGFSAHAGLTGTVAPAAVPAPEPLAGYEAEDHFPGAALLYAAEDTAAPAPGTTGTTALPDLPVAPAALAAAELPLAGGTIPAAAPFVLRGTGQDHMRALQCLTTAIYYEAANEPDAGQSAVAQVILNRVRHPAFPNTVCGVIYQGSERRGCQFSYACDGAMARVPMRTAWDRARRAAARALAGYVYAPVGLATHYHTYAVTPAWNRSLVMTDVVGAHFFHRWKGYWGTPAAFSQGYRGNEPLPGPHARIDLPVAPLAITAAVEMPAYVAAQTARLLRASGAQALAAPRTAPPTDIVPGYAQSGTPLPAYASADADAQILDRWKDSGKPLR